MGVTIDELKKTNNWSFMADGVPIEAELANAINRIRINLKTNFHKEEVIYFNPSSNKEERVNVKFDAPKIYIRRSGDSHEQLLEPYLSEQTIRRLEYEKERRTATFKFVVTMGPTIDTNDWSFMADGVPIEADLAKKINRIQTTMKTNFHTEEVIYFNPSSNKEERVNVKFDAPKIYIRRSYDSHEQLLEPCLSEQTIRRMIYEKERRTATFPFVAIMELANPELADTDDWSFMADGVPIEAELANAINRIRINLKEHRQESVIPFSSNDKEERAYVKFEAPEIHILRSYDSHEQLLEPYLSEQTIRRLEHQRVSPSATQEDHHKKLMTRLLLNFSPGSNDCN